VTTQCSMLLCVLVSASLFSSGKADAQEVILFCNETEYREAYSGIQGESSGSFSVIIDEEIESVFVERGLCESLSGSVWTKTMISGTCSYEDTGYEYKHAYNFWRLTGSFSLTITSDLPSAMTIWGKCAPQKALF
jgi:hypothetical protein